MKAWIFEVLNMIKIRRFVNYDRWTLFMSHLAHEYKRLGYSGFINKYSGARYHGIYKRYLEGYMEWLTNREFGIEVECKKHPIKLVAEPYIHMCYYGFKDKNILKESMKQAIPEFLSRGLLLTEVQEAVNCTRQNNHILKGGI